MNETISDKFNEIIALPKGDRVVALHKMSKEEVRLKDILSLAFDPNIEWLLPDGVPPYVPSKEPKPHLKDRLRNEIPSIKMLFLNIGDYPNLKSSKREQIFIDILQSLEPEDAKLLLLLKDRKLPDGLDFDLISEAFPILAEKWSNKQNKA